MPQGVLRFGIPKSLRVGTSLARKSQQNAGTAADGFLALMGVSRPVLAIQSSALLLSASSADAARRCYIVFAIVAASLVATILPFSLCALKLDSLDEK